MHAARHHGVEAVGVTSLASQAELATERVAEAGLADRVEIRLQDYRDVDDGPYDAISSIGMFEHVGLAKLGEYFDRLLRARWCPAAACSTTASAGPPVATRMSRLGRSKLHRPLRVPRRRAARGRHRRLARCSSRASRCATSRACASTTRSRCGTGSPTSRPTGTRRSTAVGRGRARVWRLYMAASALNFEGGRTQIHQVLAVKPDGGRVAHAAPSGLGRLTTDRFAGAMAFAFLDHPGPIPFAHRGGAGEWPENTMPAFEGAVRLGYRYVETDVHVTADGVLLAFHDDVLDRVTDRSGVIAELPWDVVAAAPRRRPRADPAARGPARHVARPPRQHRPEARRRGRAAGRASSRSATPSTECASASFSDKRVARVRKALGPGAVHVARAEGGARVSVVASRGVPAGRFHQPVRAGADRTAAR